MVSGAGFKKFKKGRMHGGESGDFVCTYYVGLLGRITPNRVRLIPRLCTYLQSPPQSSKYPEPYTPTSATGKRRLFRCAVDVRRLLEDGVSAENSPTECFLGTGVVCTLARVARVCDS